MSIESVWLCAQNTTSKNAECISIDVASHAFLKYNNIIIL